MRGCEGAGAKVRRCDGAGAKVGVRRCEGRRVVWAGPLGPAPSFDDAAPPADARDLYEALVRELRAAHVPVSTGEFQAMMHVELVNDGPVTVLVDSRRQF